MVEFLNLLMVVYMPGTGRVVVDTIELDTMGGVGAAEPPVEGLQPEAVAPFTAPALPAQGSSELSPSS